LNLHNVSDVRQIEVHTAERLVSGPCRLELETVIEKLKKYKSSGSDQIPTELIQAGINDSISNNFAIKFGVPQCSVLGPLLHLLYAADLTENPNTTICGRYHDPLSQHKPCNSYLHFVKLFESNTRVDKKCKIKINKVKSTPVNFSLRREQCPAAFFNNIQIPASPCTKYLGIYLDNHLTWKEHIKKKLKQIDLKIKDMYWLIGTNSKLSLEN
jgi:hypothetical protein